MIETMTDQQPLGQIHQQTAGRTTVPQERRIAVVGSGVAGLTAAYVLAKRTTVTLYEADDRLGGHADTHEVTDSAGVTQRVDTGFIVHNRRTYPTLLRLFAELDVPTQASDMSMSVHCDGCGLEYAGAKGPRGLFAQPRSLTRPRYLRMLGEVLRFHRQAKALLATPPERVPTAEQTLGQFLDIGDYSTYFRSHFMTPVVAAVWSTAPNEADLYPARYLFAFLQNHGMLSVTGSPTWRTVVGGSRTYVERVAKNLPDIRTGAPVTRIGRVEGGVEITASGRTDSYEGVVIATHPHQALAMLAEPTAAERDVLGAIHYTPNETVLHHDARMLPTAPRARASWNYRMDDCTSNADSVVLSYDMNRLQALDSVDPWVVTLNATHRLQPGSIVDTMAYEHPLYTPESVAAQSRLPELADDVVAYAGAYHGWGFHEDGALSGLKAAESLGVRWA